MCGSEIRSPDSSKLSINWINDHDFKICGMTLFSIFFDGFLFLLSNLVTNPSFMSISSLVLDLSKFCFIRDSPETWKSDITPSEFCPISGDWGKLGIPNLTRMFPI